MCSSMEASMSEEMAGGTVFSQTKCSRWYGSSVPLTSQTALPRYQGFGHHLHNHTGHQRRHGSVHRPLRVFGTKEEVIQGMRNRLAEEPDHMGPRTVPHLWPSCLTWRGLGCILQAVEVIAVPFLPSLTLGEGCLGNIL